MTDWPPSHFTHAAHLWKRGKSTMDIARALGCHESECWNRLDQIKTLREQ